MRGNTLPTLFISVRLQRSAYIIVANTVQVCLLTSAMGSPNNHDSHHYDNVNYDGIYEEIDGNQINDIPVNASSGDRDINDESYDDCVSRPTMPRCISLTDGSYEADTETDTHVFWRNGTESASSHLSVRSYSELGCMVAYSRRCSYSSYNDSRVRDSNGQILASKEIYTSLRSLVSVGESYQLLCYDLETMVEIFRDDIEDDVDARRIVTYLTFLPPYFEREINQTFRESPKRSIKMLIDKIKDVREYGKWETFVKALEHVGYKNIAKNLRGVLQEDNRDKRKIVRIFAPQLVQQINPLEITPLLYSRSIISPCDKEEIEQENLNNGKIAAARRLLRCLHHKCSSWFEQFCDILKECKHSDLAEMLNPQTAHLDSQDTENDLQKSFMEFLPYINDLGTSEGVHTGQGQHSRGEEYQNSQFNTAVNPELMANYRTTMEDTAIEVLNKCQQGLERTLHQSFIPELRSIIEEIISRKMESVLNEIRNEIRAVRDDFSSESRSRAWVNMSSDYRQSSSGYASGNTSVYEPIPETDDEYSSKAEQEIYQDNQNSGFLAM
ncbi:hypothetical protein ACJMK2_030736 [Sinanodonta woodiana]|uniref:Caspase recruitment domain-containing protein n=1 Tax=Sinanodonta woodiana TaxID=1069815 RepID=A0ABD3X026_SINWO